MHSTSATSGPDTGHVYAHSMWRTGSTALARRFLDNPRYLVFYEPFHEACGSLDYICWQHENQTSASKDLSHPDWIGGYFDNFLLVDPLTEQPLYQLYDRSSALQTVYHDSPSDKTLRYIEACKRVATAQGRHAFFGFCRSGLQQRVLLATGADRSFYLEREPRSQFLSYNFPNNRYFLPGTLLQLARAPQLQATLKRLIRRTPNRLAVTLTDKLQGLSVFQGYRWARKMALGLDLADAYRIFYLSHTLTKRPACQTGVPCHSIDSLCSTDRTEFEGRFGVSLDGLHPNTRAVPDTAIFTKVEAEVRAVLDAELGS